MIDRVGHQLGNYRLHRLLGRVPGRNFGAEPGHPQDDGERQRQRHSRRAAAVVGETAECRPRNKLDRVAHRATHQCHVG